MIESSARITEDSLEQTALAWLESLGYDIKYGPDLAFDGPSPERLPGENYSDVVLLGRLRDALQLINPDLPVEAIEEAIRKVTQSLSRRRSRCGETSACNV